VTRTIELHGPLDEECGAHVAAAIERAAGHIIDLRIDSPGGHFGGALRLAMAIEEHDRRVITTVEREACSAAALVALAGDGRRIGKSAVIMMHFGKCHPGCSPKEVGDHAAEMFRIVCEYVPRAAPSDITEWLATERYFSAREAQAAGLVDVISDSPLPIYLREPKKREPTKWLRRWREDYERLDLR
jgi:ATP-dependent protease ClpP protease subunit